MKNPKNFEGQEGFTLVEVIVVAIIVAALAAVAVPMYTSYVTSSRQNAAANAAGSVASYMGACINQGGKVTVPTGVIPTTGLAASLLCSAGGATMQLPIGIDINISSLIGTGTVTATHTGGGNAQTYNY
ncbi:MAG TPA: prepilin-type N-terminal cleavage/methylation domain-containing protein [Fibrobacteria bacterium]|nr:prepilin-type N-terminal cleavage/methylation domain-containing protein [Fibrobacteria bacterium]